MTSLYDEMDRRTAGVSAYAILEGGKYVGRAIFINAAACTCYLQIWGAAPAKGIARGGNYDRHSAAAEVAAAKLEEPEDRPDAAAIRARVVELINDPKREGWHWDQRLVDGGFEVAMII